MGDGAGTDLQAALAAERTRAQDALVFFANVAPLAQRLGMSDLPDVAVFQTRLCQTDGLSTARLRADGVIIEQLHRSAAAQVDLQRQQVGALATAWPDGSGVVAQQRLQSMLPHAEAGVAAVSEIGAAMLVAADCIDVARLAQYNCIAGIDANTLLGVPISLWLKASASAMTHSYELRAAIAATMELFGTAVNTCDDSIEAILSGLCARMADVGTNAEPGTVQGDATRLVGGADETATGGGAMAAAGQAQPSSAPAAGGSAASVPTRSWSADAASTESGGAAISDSGGAAMADSGGAAISDSRSAAAVSTGGSAPGSVSNGGVSVAAAGYLEPVLGVVGTVAAAAVGGLVEAITSVVAQQIAAGVDATGPNPEPSVDPAGGQEATAPGGASITLGDKVIEITAGADGASLDVTVTGAGGAVDTHTLTVGPDGSVAVSTVGAEPAAGPDAVSPAAPQAIAPDGPATGSAGGGQIATSAPDQSPCPPPVVESEVDAGRESVPLPEAVASADGVAAPQSPVPPAPGPPLASRSAAPADNSGTVVLPQSSRPGDVPDSPEDGQLALAGDQ